MRRGDWPPLVATVVVLLVLAGDVATPLGPLLDPRGGVLQNAGDAVPLSGTRSIPGLQAQVQVVQDVNGVYHIYAANDHDLFLALGYVQAHDRLWQMDIFRRAAKGNLTPILGSDYQGYDAFQVRAGLYITARADWASMQANASSDPTSARSVAALQAYAAGVNAYASQAEAAHGLPVMFKLLGYQPATWSPVDSILVEKYMSETLEFGDPGLIYSLMDHVMGNTVQQVLPAFAPVHQEYYGGYHGAPNPAVLALSEHTWPVNDTVASLAYQVHQDFAAYDPPSLFPSSGPDHSNQWAVAGNRTDTGSPYLVGGPVLAFTLPSIWFQVALNDPTYHVNGVILPGAPVAVIGFNDAIAWTLTDTQAIADGTFFLAQQVRDGRYLYDGAWHPLTTYHVDGTEVNWTNWGPVLAANGSTALVMHWMGNTYSDDLGALLGVMRSTSWNQFRDSLRGWRTPYENFAFASRYHTGDISPAAYPIWGRSDGGLPWNPGAILPGDGSQTITGMIPFDQVPQVADPAQGFVVSSNQRQVGPAYPYWYGNTMTFSVGTRALVEAAYLRTHPHATIGDMKALQWNVTDVSAELVLPAVLRGLETSSDPTVHQGVAMLRGWDAHMAPTSSAATLWFFLYQHLYNDTFQPFWNRTGFHPAYASIRFSAMGGTWPGTQGLASLDLDLIHMIRSGQAAPFLAPGTTLTSLEAQAMKEAMADLHRRAPGGNASWGRFYGFEFPSMTGSDAWSVGPLSQGGDFFTVNDASGVLPQSPAAHGQSWTMVANLSNLSSSWGVYPGGQSEDPASPLYSNYIHTWIHGDYLPIRVASNPDQLASADRLATLVLTPGGSS